MLFIHVKTKYEIVAELAKAHVVEDMCCNIAHVPSITADIQDLAQIVYIALLEYKDEYIIDMAKDSAIRFFIARMIINQWRTDHSPFRDLVTDFSSRTEELDGHDKAED